ncbi:MAG: hypothetical protein WAM14_18935, partial [Candidatus Nitrosopolaris sp.]
MNVVVGKDSPFYQDARRHMPKKMKQDIDDLEMEMDLNTYNAYIQKSNIVIDSRIKEIIARPIYAKLTDGQISSIYRILQFGFSRAIKHTEEVSTYIKNWGFSSKLRLHGFNTEQEINTATTILGTIEYDQNIIELVTKVQNNRMDLEEKIDIIKNQSKKISSKIDSHQYQSRHRCCPSFI